MKNNKFKKFSRRNMPISYNWSGDKEDFGNLLRKFELDSLLKRIDGLSQSIMRQKWSELGYGTVETDLLIQDVRTKRFALPHIIIAAWDLIDLSYYAILSSNDFRGASEIDDDELKLLCAAERTYYGKKESQVIDETHDTVDFMLYLWGFAGEQFKFQEYGEAFDTAGRELYILFESGKSIGFDKIKNVVQEETGVAWSILVSSLLLACFGFLNGGNINIIKKQMAWDEEFTAEDFQKVIDRFTTMYEEIRESSLRRQILYTKPYVLTQRREIISVNAFLNLFVYEHAVLWAVRDNYKRNGSQQFTSDFGKMFEEYFRETLSTYLTKEDYEKIPEGKKIRADWRVNLCGYKLIVEQKSAILQLDAKQQNSDYKATVKYVERTIIKALRQLKSTEDELALGTLQTRLDELNGLASGKYIKVILLYDDYFKDNLLDSVFRMESCDVENDHCYWLVSINEMEMLLSLCATNERLCREILEEKNKRELDQSSEGRSLKQLFRHHSVTKNPHMESEKMKYYRDYAREFMKEHLMKLGSA